MKRQEILMRGKNSMTQKETVFQPNPKMLKLLEAAVDPDTDASISSWCRKAGVARVQWYRWQGLSGFLSWFNTEYRKSFDGIRAALVKVGIQKALSGDFQFWKIMMEKTGEYGPSLKVEGDRYPSVIIDAGENPYKDFKNMSDEELNRWLDDNKKGIKLPKLRANQEM